MKARQGQVQEAETRQGKQKRSWDRSRRCRRGKGSESEAGISPGGRDKAREAKAKLGQVQEV